MMGRLMIIGSSQNKPKKCCRVKIFLGSSTGNMLVDNEAVLEKYFQVHHC
jgi:hypothetical protein